MSKDVETFARQVGLHVATWSPGDGMTRYRFFDRESDYDSGEGLVTVGGRKDALLWLRGYSSGKGSVMAMGKKDYEMIAGQIDSLREHQTLFPQEKAVLRAVVSRLSSAFMADNPRFDPDKFTRACGF